MTRSDPSQAVRCAMLLRRVFVAVVTVGVLVGLLTMARSPNELAGPGLEWVTAQEQSCAKKTGDDASEKAKKKTGSVKKKAAAAMMKVDRPVAPNQAAAPRESAGIKNAPPVTEFLQDLIAAARAGGAQVLSNGDSYDDFASVCQASDGTVVAAYAAYFDGHDQIRIHRRL